VEQAAFSSASIVPGIELSADKLLQGMAFSYADTQRYRVGTNYLELPVNRSLTPVNNNQRDGAMQYGSYGGGTVNYQPNTLAGGASHEVTVTGTPAVCHIEDNIVQKKIALTDDYTQAGERYRSLSKMDQDHLVDNITDSLSKAAKPIQQSMVDHFTKADSELGKRVAMGLEL